MWVSKDAEIRRKELLDAALELFYERGYDKTSVNDIIAKVGVTKGAFYYHFKSKDEVLDTIALQQAQEMVAAFASAARAEYHGFLERLNGTISSLWQYRTDTQRTRLRMSEVLDKSENIVLKSKIYKYYTDLSKPVIMEILDQGLREGIVTTDFPEEMAEFFIQFSLTANGTINRLVLALKDRPENIQLIDNRARFFEEILHKILGVKEGSIKYANTVLKSVL